MKRPKLNIHVGEIVVVGEVEHRLPPRKGVRKTVMVPLKYQIMADGSRYPFAHSCGGRHPDWLTKGAN